MHRPPANRVSGPGWIRGVVGTPAKWERGDESPEVRSCLELLIGGCAQSDPRKAGVGTVNAENRALPALPSVGPFRAAADGNVMRIGPTSVREL